MTKNIRFRNGPISAKRFWNIAEVDGDSAEITMYGDVVPQQPIDWWTGEPLPGQYISPEGFAEDLAQIKDKKTINIKINSCGGDVYTALAIHNALKSLPGHKNVIVEGIAASAASVIAMAGDTVKVYPGSIIMIHGVSCFVYDYVQISDLKKLVKAMDASERAISAIYAGKTGTDETILRAMMDKETYMTGAEALNKGFADELLDGTEPVMQLNAAENILIVNGIQHHIDGLHIPDWLHIPMLAAGPKQPVDHISSTPTEPKGEQNAMTLEELKEQHPDLVAQIAQDAVEKDRARIQEIEEIQDTIGDAALIAEAKFTKPTNAAELALAAMKKQAALGADYLQNRKKELQDAQDVGAEPAKADDPLNMGKADEAETKAKIAELGNLYKTVFK